jgi:PAS domain S-box-containing protein
MPDLTPEASKLLLDIDPANEALLVRWTGALRQVGGMYGTLDDNGLSATARRTVAIFQRSLPTGVVASSSARRYVDPPPYRQQPLDEFVLAGLLVNRVVGEYFHDHGPNPTVAREATAVFSRVMVAGILDVVRMRKDRKNLGEQLVELTRTLAGAGSTKQRLDRASSRIAQELGAGPCLIFGLNSDHLHPLGCSMHSHGQSLSLTAPMLMMEDHPWLPRVLTGGLREFTIDSEGSPLERQFGLARYTTMHVRALVINDTPLGLMLVLADDRRSLDQALTPHLDVLATVLAPHVALSIQTDHLEKAESAIEELFETSPNLMCTLDRLGRIQRTNSTFRQRIGVADDLVGMPLSWLVHPGWLERFTEQWHRVQHGPGAVIGERLDLLNAQSERIPLALEARWLRHGSDAPTQCLVVLSDIARHVAQAEADANQIDELNAFAHQIAHDLRAPLRSIAGFASLLEESFDTVEPPDARLYTERIEHAVDRADVLITGLLRFAQTTHLNPRVDELAPAELMADALAGIGGLLEQRQVDVVLVLAEQQILGDRTALSTLLMNLIDNGTRYSPPGGRVEVAVRSAHPGWATLEVRDQGPGIALGDQARIFRLFERGTDPSSGTGIGLAVVQRIARAHGGRVKLVSELGKGALFQVTLPAA